jgi:hypothetical protein
VRCVECGKDAESEAADCLAVLVDLPDEPDEPEVFVFCPTCYEREFRAEDVNDPTARIT